ncbi:type I-C CRISPR-associated endonuclease Cas1c [Collinsella intestinalis]|uniref:type I-C CRISPR-associated endonuclease Cas1c n=1 Tax=Collinsella intestinalis TaxID=147207 RepID=UPI0019575221|nr:type I-C CRISPR-associated endonuclease Cas1c [Collinsella intestinalis]MBM6907267.1 type I-C CRISPR-associated endonuclease Cas1 [Collinsella intestinalis]
MKRLLNTLYVTNPDARLRKKDDAICVAVDGAPSMSVPFHVLESIVLFGHVGCSMALLAACAERGVSVTILDERGRFKARVEGETTGNVLLRREQYRMAADADACLRLSRRFVMAKIHNARIVLQHYARDYPDIAEGIRPVVEYLQRSKAAVTKASTLDGIRGVEGDAAHAYFSAFPSLLRADDVSDLFCGRSRRPPKDPVNATLSFFYTMLSRDITSACESVGLDPQMGFLHACRPGRESLALDVIEELRAFYVDRFVLTLFNRGQLDREDFRFEAGGAVFFREHSIKRALSAWQKKKQENVTHPFLRERIPYGLLPFVQAQLLARYLRGDLNDYPACLWR